MPSSRKINLKRINHKLAIHSPKIMIVICLVGIYFVSTYTSPSGERIQHKRLLHPR